MKITGNVYLLPSTRFSRVYLVTGNENTLIDTGLSYNLRGILKDLDTLLVPLSSIRHIYLSHHDIDHIGNAAALQNLCGAKLYAPKEDIPYIMGEKEREGFKKTAGKIMRVKKPENIRPFVSGEVLNGIRVIPTPGHTPGHVCFLYSDVLFAGDLLYNKKRKLVPYNPAMDWDYNRLKQSIREVYDYPFKWVCPAHSAPCLRGKGVPDDDA